MLARLHRGRFHWSTRPGVPDRCFRGEVAVETRRMSEVDSHLTKMVIIAICVKVCIALTCASDLQVNTWSYDLCPQSCVSF